MWMEKSNRYEENDVPTSCGTSCLYLSLMKLVEIGIIDMLSDARRLLETDQRSKLSSYSGNS